MGVATITTIGVEGLLVEARSQIERLSPRDTNQAVGAGDLLVDIRPLEQRRRDGLVPGATVVDRNVLEWRLDPRGEHRDRALARTDRRVILVCDEGYQSSLAAATLRRFGVDACDVVGGVQEWRAAGLPLLPAQ
ncbi:MAG TPA: rhodanese-like domain-containing protein [Solirubrobacterales bacterium]|nr:rhodanese-like domain-containing protein [Solirubrobacterales bacterium]